MPKLDSVEISQFVYTSVAQRYWNDSWTTEKNQQVYGTEASAEGLGSNMRLEVTLRAPPEVDETLLVAPLAKLKSMVDHQSVPETLEKISLRLAAQLFALPGDWAALRVDESPHLWCVCRPQQREVELFLRVANLTLSVLAPVDSESGLAVRRAEVLSAATQCLAACAPMEPKAWSQNLFKALKAHIKILQSVRIDLGRHEYLLVQSNS